MRALTFLAAGVAGAGVLAAAALGTFAWRTRRLARMAETLVPPRGRFVEAGGTRLHVVARGEGRPILFVHGLGSHLLHFTQPLFDRLSGFRLVAYDRAGSGYSSRARGATGGVWEQAGEAAALIEALGLERPLVVGHSLGGAVALALALDHRETVSGLALLAPLTTPIAELPPELKPLQIRSALLRRLVAYTVAAPGAVRSADAVLARVFGPQSPPPDYATTGGGAMALLRPEHFIGSSLDSVAFEADIPAITSRLEELRLPVGILFGDADRILDHRAQALALRGRIGGLEVEVLAGVGHMPQYAEPERVAAFIRHMAGKAFAAHDRAMVRTAGIEPARAGPEGF